MGRRRVDLGAVAFFFFFNATATTEIYTLSLHDALPICRANGPRARCHNATVPYAATVATHAYIGRMRSEEHTSELQSRLHLVCRLLLEKKKEQRPVDAPSEVLFLTVVRNRHPPYLCLPA